MRSTRRRTALRGLPVFAVLGLLAVAAVGQGAPDLQVKGSDTIGGALGPDLAAAYMERHADVVIDWEGLGSGTAFVGLFDGSADLGASSRSIKDKEIDEARRLGLRLKEFVLGYDGIAVLVHPSNPVEMLTIDQLSAIFTGEITHWSAVGGPDAPIRLISRPSYSGTHGFFKNTVVRQGDKKGPEEFAPSTQFVEHSEEIAEMVGGDPNAISYLGMGWQSPETKSVAVAPVAGEPGVLPALDTVREGTYPIYRPLLLYTIGEPQGLLRNFLVYVLAGEGQALVQEHGFIPADSPSVVTRRASAPTAEPADAGIEIQRVYFSLGGTRLTLDAQETLRRIAEQLEGSERRALVIGHADASGNATINERIAQARAETVKRQLVRYGVPAERIVVENRGATEPIATNDTAAGRRQNRRADVRILD